MRSTNPQILKNQILRCVTQSESTRVDRDRNPGSNPGWCKKKGGALDVVETLQMKWIKFNFAQTIICSSCGAMDSALDF